MLSVLALACGSAQAQTVDVDAAADVARQFFASQALSGPNRAPAKVDPVLSYTATTEDIPDFYVFNRADDAPGFVIVSAADAQTPILGYSENGTFDYATAPDNFRWWLQQYQQNGVAKAPARVSGRHDIDAIVTTQWGQNEPYNLAIPMITPTSKRIVTGCTATAMAQIMKHHNYPATGRGSESYQTYTWTTSSGKVTPTFEADFEHTTYQWGIMHDTYASTDRSASAMAAATLIYHAGVAEHAMFDQTETSADDRASGIALINHFRYSPAMLRGERAYFTDDEWNNTIYEELAAGRPILYSGTTTKDEGHSFVCDGYQAATNLFHMNWGWQGVSDGFFALVGDKALKPNEQGTGGAPSGLGFTQSQSINYNILPTEAGEYPVQLAVFDHFLVGTDRVVDHTFTNKTIDRSRQGADIPVYVREAPYNYGFATVVFRSGVLLRHTTTGRLYPQMGFANDMELESSTYNEYYYSVSETDLTPVEYAHFNTTTAPYNGTYEIVPAYTTDNGLTWHPMPILASDSYPTITIVGGEDAEAVELPFTLTATEVEVGKTVTITPHRDYTGTVLYHSSDNTIATVTPEGVVTGLREGHVTITATSAATAAFLATTKTFEIDVVGHIMHNVDVSISKNFLTVGETATITLTDGYDGAVTYTVAPAGVVAVSPTGTVTALADGEAVITVTVAGNADYKPTTKQFAVSVSSAPPAPVVPGFCFDNFPYTGENNIVTSSDMTLHIPLYNNSTSAISPSTFYVRMNCNGGSVLWTCGFGSSAYPAGYKYDYTIDPSEKYGGFFTPGKVYTYQFFLDEGCTKPMNVPSLTYYYCPNNPSVATLTTLIDNAKKGNGATVKIIKALANKLVGK